ncbi:retrotransposon gag family protein, partial [Mesorhizobium amorphae]|uniref:retrotransposon gag family protein n=1 Tax=Mesorhizobium amorphae TaxID=71433 RepID=UPI0024E13D1B
MKNFEANSEYISLALFPFSLRDKAKFWFNSLPKGSIGSWTELITVFLEKYFPVKRTAKMRAQITSFKQGYDESFDDAWERFNRLIQTCPHHNLSKLTVADTFYDGLSQECRTMVDYSAGGTIVDKDPQEVLDLFDRLAQQQQWSNRESMRGQKGRYEVDEMAMLRAKVDALQLRLEKGEGTSKMVHAQSCALCGEGHDYEQCPLRQPEVEEGQVNSINNEPSYLPKPPFTRPYSNDPIE